MSERPPRPQPAPRPPSIAPPVAPRTSSTPPAAAAPTHSPPPPLPSAAPPETLSAATPSSHASKHTFNDSEVNAFVDHLNSKLRDPSAPSPLPDFVPVHPPATLFDVSKDGLLLARLLARTKAECIDLGRINTVVKNKHHMIENQTMVLAGAEQIGCRLVNIGPEDLVDGKEYLVLGVLWQIIKVGLMNEVTISKHPELIRLVETDAGEDLQTLVDMTPEDILLRWMNHHLRKAGYERTITNFTTDIKDGTAYTVLLNQIAPDKCDLAPLQEHNGFKRAELLLSNAGRIGCRKFLTPSDLVTGNPRLNLAFVANLFNKVPGLSLPNDDDFHTLKEQNASLCSALDRLSMDRNRVDAKLESLSADNTKMSESVQNLTQMLTTTMTESRALSETNAQLREDNRALNQRLADMASQLIHAQEKVTQTVERMSEMQSVGNVSSAELDGLNQQNVALQKENAALERKEAENSSENAQLRAQIAQLTERVRELEGLLAESKKRFDDFSVDSALQLSETVDRLTRQKQASDEQREELVEENAALRELVEAIQETNQDLEAEKARFEESHKTLSRECDELREETHTLTQLSESLAEEKEEADMRAEESVAQAQTRIVDLENDVKQSDRKMEKLTVMMESLQRMVGRNGAYASQLRELYNSFKTNKLLAMAIYKSVAAADLERKNAWSGALRRPDRKEGGNKEFHHVLKDHLLFVYKMDKKSDPIEVIRVDDCLIDRTTVPGQYAITLKIAYPEALKYVLEADSETSCDAWMQALNSACAWWADKKRPGDTRAVSILM